MTTLAIFFVAMFLLIGLIIWIDDAAMHKAEHDDSFHEHHKA
jgi:ATP/ADP translocase